MQEGRERVLNLRAGTPRAPAWRTRWRRLAINFGSIHPAHFQVSVQGRPRPLDTIVQEEILLIGREALTNAFTHSGAQNIVAELSYHSGGSASVRER